MKPAPQPPPSRAVRRAQSQEGAVLLLVLMMVLMSTVSATFAVQEATHEIAAAGSVRQAMAARQAAETGVMVAPAALRTLAGALAGQQMDANEMGGAGGATDRFYLPAPATADGETHHYQRWGGDAWAGAGLANPAAAQLTVEPAGSPYTSDYTVLLDGFVAGGTTHITATIYGERTVNGDAVQAQDENGIHTTLSLARAFYSVSSPSN